MKAFLDFFSYSSLLISIMLLILTNFILYISKTHNKKMNEVFAKIRKVIVIVIIIFIIITVVKLIFGLI